MNPESERLVLKAEEGLEVAGNLIADGHYDFAAGRAYYAMYNITQAALLEKEKVFSSHRAVHNAFYHEFVQTGLIEREHHSSLVRGFELRQSGDYAGFQSVPREKCEDMLVRASAFIEAVRVLLV